MRSPASSRRGTRGLVLACLLLATGCVRGVRTYPFLADARSAKVAGDHERAYGAATFAVQHAGLLETPEDERREAEDIARSSLVALAEARIAAAHALPKTDAGLAARLAKLEPVLADKRLEPLHDRARAEIAAAMLAMWERAEPGITKENYAAPLDALARLRVLAPKGHAVFARADALRRAMARAHEARAAEPVTGQPELGVALRRYHLERAAALGADHTAEIARLDAALRSAIGVAYVVKTVDGPATCAPHRDAITSALAASGKHPVELEVTIERCAVTREVTTDTRTRTYRVPVTTKRMAEVPVFDGYAMQSRTDVKDHYCWGNVASGGKTCSTTTQTTSTPVPRYHYELVEVEETTYESRETKYPVRTKRKRARFAVRVKATAEGMSTSFLVEGAEDFEDVEVSGDSGEDTRKFGPERPDANMLDAARRRATAEAVSRVRNLGPERLARALAAYEAAAAGDPLREEAVHAARVWTGSGVAGYDRSKAWLDRRWGGGTTEGELASMVAAFKAPLSPEPMGRYEHEEPVPPSYLNVAHGAGYLVSSGLSFEATARQAALDASRSHHLAGAAFALGDGTQALRLRAAGASSSISGDAYGYAVGAEYALSLRGETDERHRITVVASAGVLGGVTRLDDGLVDSPLKERFVQTPLALTASVPFYYVSLQARVAFAPNLLALSEDAAWKTFHPASGWIGIAPVPWLLLEGGAELPLGAADLAPRIGGRLGLRL